MPAPKWYEDWEMTVTRSSLGDSVTVVLPHNDPKITVVELSDGDNRAAINLLDKLLCELTGTKGNKLVS